VVLGAIFQPLTIMWIAIAFVVIVSAIAMAGRRKIAAHPYANMAPLSSFTRGIVTPEEAMNERRDYRSRRGAA
jgi:hypothetical protein